MKMNKEIFLATLTSFALLLVLPISVVYAHGGDSSLIHACVKKRGGTMRMVNPSTRCAGNERAIDWNSVGLTGAIGPQGATGPQGPSDVYSTYNGTFVEVETTQTTLGTLNLSAGSYMLIANGTLNTNNAANQSFDCRLTAESDVDGAGGTNLLTITPQDDRENTTLMLTHTFAAAGTATFSCSLTIGNGNVGGPRLTAIRVGNITTQ